MGDDLMITNQYQTTNQSGLLKNINTDSIDHDKNPLDELSYGYNQYSKLLKKENLIQYKKTILNIDSRNRQQYFNFTKIKIILKNDFNFITLKNDCYFYLIIKESIFGTINKNIIINSVEDNILETFNITNREFIEFSAITGKPILNIESFHYNKNIDSNNYIEIIQNIDLYNVAGDKKFNILKIPLPSVVDKQLVKAKILKSSLSLNFINNIRNSYTNPSHYKISLGKDFSKIHSIKLLSSEIPNTGYIFNNNKLKTKEFSDSKYIDSINNRLAWINKKDSIKEPNFTINEFKNVHNSYFYNDLTVQSTLQTDQNNINKLLFNINKHSIILQLSSNMNQKILDNTVLELNDYGYNSQIYVYKSSVYKSLDSIVFISDYEELFNRLYSTIAISQDYLNLYHINDNIKIDGIHNTELNNGTYILLSQQSNKNENNIYKFTKNTIATILYSPGSQYSSQDLLKLKLFMYNNQSHKYVFFNDKNIINGGIMKYLEISLTLEGSINNILIDNIIKNTNLNNIMTPLNKNRLNILPGGLVSAINNKYYNNLLDIENQEHPIYIGDIIVPDTTLNITVRENIITNIVVNKNGTNFNTNAVITLKLLLKDAVQLENIFIKLSFEYLISPYKIDFEEIGSINSNKKKLLNSISGELVPLNGLSIPNGLYGSCKLYNDTIGFDSETFQYSYIDVGIGQNPTTGNKEVVYLACSLDNIKNILLIGDGYFTHTEYKLNITINNQKYTEVILKFEKANLNITSGNSAKFFIFLSASMERIIKTSNESSNIINKGFLNIYYLDEHYNYIYKCLKGDYNNNTYYIIEKKMNTYTFTKINYDKRIHFLNSFIKCDKIINQTYKNSRDYYYDFNFMGKFNQFGISTIQNKHIVNSVSFLNKNIIFDLEDNFKFFYKIIGYTAPFEDTKNCVFFNFINNFKLELNYLASTENFIDKNMLDNILKDLVLPIKVTFISLDSVLIYNYYISNITKQSINFTSSRIKFKYIFNLIPTYGSFDIKYTNPPFLNSKTCLMVLHKPISNNNLNNLQAQSPDIYSSLKTKFIYNDISVNFANLSISSADFNSAKIDINEHMNRNYFNTPSDAYSNQKKKIEDNIYIFSHSIIHPHLEEVEYNNKLSKILILYKPHNTLHIPTGSLNINFSSKTISIPGKYIDFIDFNYISKHFNILHIKSYSTSGNYINYYNFEIINMTHTHETYMFKFNNNSSDLFISGQIAMNDVSFSSKKNENIDSLVYVSGIDDLLNNKTIQRMTYTYFENSTFKIQNKYIEFFIIKLLDSYIFNPIISNSHKKYIRIYKVSYKTKINLKTILFSLQETYSPINIERSYNFVYLNSYTLHNNIYCKLSSDILINPFIDNQSANNNDSNIDNSFNTIEYDTENNEYGLNKFGNYLRYYDDNIDTQYNNNPLLEFIDIMVYSQMMLTINTLSKFTDTSIRKLTDVHFNITPNYNTVSHYIPRPIPLLSNEITNKHLFINEIYPTYSWDIIPGNYNENIFKRSFETNVNKLALKSYDFNKRDFVTRTQNKMLFFNKQNSNKFNINFNTYNSTLDINQYGNIANAVENNTKFVYYNKGFPYLYFKLFNVTLPNGQTIYIEGLPNIDNNKKYSLNTEHPIIVCNNYSIKIRQLSLVNSDLIQNLLNKNTPTVDYDYKNTLYNEFIDYTNDFYLPPNIKDSLKKSFINNNGNNEYYTKEYNQEYLLQYVSKLINNTKNAPPLESTESSGFLNNELFVKLNSLFSDDNYKIIGRITYMGGVDKNSNYTIQYDLFKKNSENFTIGDMIIGLDSGAIGFILPEAYSFYKLPNNELILLGMGFYILNKYRNINNHFLSFYNSISNTETQTKDNIEEFIINFSKWGITKNNTPNGFYIKVDNFNTSNLGGMYLKNVNIFLPSKYLFLHGDNSALDVLGITKTNYTDIFNSNKNNYKTYDISYIRHSYIFNPNDYDRKIIIEIENTNKFNIGDKIYLENHNIITDTSEFNRSLLLKNKHIGVFSDFLNDMKVLYNEHILMNPLIPTDKYFSDDTTKINWNTAFVIPTSNESILEPQRCQVIYYTNDVGNIVEIFILSTGIGYIDEHNRVLDNVSSDFKFSVEIIGGNIHKILPFNSTAPTLKQGHKIIPFTNKLYGVEFNQDLNKYSTVYNLIFKSLNNKYETGSFGVEREGNLIFSIFYFEHNVEYNILDITNNDFENNKYRLDIIDSLGNIYSGPILKIYIQSEYKQCVFINLDNDFILNNDQKYTIQIIQNRNIVSASNTYTNHDNTLTIKNNMYQTMGIWYRLMYSYLHKKLTLPSLFSHLENDSRYNIDDYFNRIIKLKVSPVDNKGFSYENMNSADVHLNVGDYKKKLFPYHLKNNKGSINRIVNPNGNLNFLPGMGVYIIEEEVMVNNFSKETVSNKFIGYGHYKYKTKFIGYVLNTSIKDSDNYIINSENFSEGGGENEIHSEYFIYLLIDPFIKTKDEINSLFNSLDKDNIHLVYDGTYTRAYTPTLPLIEPGIMNDNAYYSYKYNQSGSGSTYILDENKSLIKDDTKINNDNVYGINGKYTSDRLQIYKDRYASTPLTEIILNHNDTNVNLDLLQKYLHGCIIIEKNALNNTLKNYSYNTLACATITERCVFHTEDNHKLFSYGNLELFYNEQYKDKTVLEYEQLLEKDKKKLFNEHNINIKTTSLYYNKKNKYETYFHQNKYMGSMNNNELINGIKPSLIFDDNSSIVLKTNSHNTVLHKNISIKEPKILPNIIFDNYMAFDTIFNEFSTNKIILDLDFTKDVKLAAAEPSTSKVKLGNFDILGNNSAIYNASDEQSYCKIKNILELSNYEHNFLLKGYMITSYSIALLNINNSNQFILPNIYNNSSEATIESYDSVLNKTTIPIFKNLAVIMNSAYKDTNGILPDNNINNIQFGIIEEAIVYNPGEIFNITPNTVPKQFNEKIIIFKFKNKILNVNLQENGYYYLYNPIMNINQDIIYNETTDTFNVILDDTYNNTIHYDYIVPNDLIALDYGNKRQIEISDDLKGPYIINNNFEDISTTYFTKIKSIKKTDGQTIIEIDFSPIIYLKDTKIMVFKNILLNNEFMKSELNDPILYNTLSTQPFIHNSEWYTKVFFRSPKINRGVYRTNTHKYQQLFNNLTEADFNDTFYNILNPSSFFVNNMKGISIPFSDLNTDENNILQFKETFVHIKPLDNSVYKNVINIQDTFAKNKYILKYNQIKGSFITDGTKHKWVANDITKNHNFITIKGIYMGFGGIIQNRHDQEMINQQINKHSGYNIQQIQTINDKKYLFISNDENSIHSDTNATLKLSYNTFLEMSLINRNNLSINDGLIRIYGEGGQVVKKSINKIYDFNLDNYIYLIIPNLNHIETVQNNIIDNVFAKILMPVSSDKVLYNTFVNSEKIFDNNLFNNLNELEVAFATDKGRLYDFNGIDHSFSIEITEIIDRLEYINPKFEKIESF